MALDPKNIGPNEEQWEEYVERVRPYRRMVQYDRRDGTGKLYSCVRSTLDRCRAECDRQERIEQARTELRQLQDFRDRVMACEGSMTIGTCCESGRDVDHGLVEGGNPCTCGERRHFELLPNGGGIRQNRSIVYPTAYPIPREVVERAMQEADHA